MGAIALVLVLSASVLLVLASSRRWVALAGLGATVVLAVIGARRLWAVPFLAAIGIAAIDALLFAAGGEALT